MGKYQKMLNKAELQLSKAENLFEAMQYKKAGKTFISAGDIFLKFNEYKLAEESFYNAAKSFAKGEKIDLVLVSLRNAGNVCLFVNDFSEAHDYFKNALDYIPYLKNARNRNYNYILFSTLTYFCLFVKGQQEQGLNLIKKVKKKVDNGYFKENPLIRLVKNLTVATRDINEKYIDNIEDNFEEYEFREAEEKFLKEIMVVAKSQISIATKLKTDKDEYVTNELINLTLSIDASRLLKISAHPYYNYTINKLKVTKLGLTLTDNLTAHEKPSLPLEIKPGQEIQANFVVKPQFQRNESIIGPILLTCELDDKFTFFVKTNELKPKLVSPPAFLEISTKNLRPPLIGQTFPYEILIQNNSKGEALEIDINVDFPKKLKMMRGTTKKQIYSLRMNEKIAWQISLKPIEAGDYVIGVFIKFKDPNGNLIDDTKKFPLSVKM